MNTRMDSRFMRATDGTCASILVDNGEGYYDALFPGLFLRSLARSNTLSRSMALDVSSGVDAGVGVGFCSPLVVWDEEEEVTPSNSESLERTWPTSLPVAVWMLYIVARFFASRLSPGMQMRMARCGLVSKILAKNATIVSAPMSIGSEAISNTISSPSLVAEKSNVCSSPPESPRIVFGAITV